MQTKRKQFLQSAAVAGASLLAAGKSLAANRRHISWTDDLNVAVIGAGKQGLEALTEDCLGIKGIRFKAVCDIWPHRRDCALSRLREFKPRVYEDYREMLAQEKDLDAVIIATPDWMHAEHANACMNAGLHVYCEKEMSNSIEKAKSMVLTSRATGKLLQIGHQRRSNPRYLHAIDKLIKGEKLLGRVTHAYAQWNRSKKASQDIPVSEKVYMDRVTLEKYGYASMDELKDWRWYRKFGGGPIVDLGSHQIDLFSWVWGVNPRSVMASGGCDFFKGMEWYDNVMTIYEYDTPQGMARAFYQVLTTTSRGGFYETFMGENGTVVISEIVARGNIVEREMQAPEWNGLAARRCLDHIGSMFNLSTRNTILDIGATMEGGKWMLPLELAKKEHQPHLENFFEAIRNGVPLNCPGELAYETAVAVLAANESVASGRKVEFKPEDFRV